MRPIVRILVMFLPRILREVQRYMKKRDRAPKHEEVYKEEYQEQHPEGEYTEQRKEKGPKYDEDELVP